MSRAASAEREPPAREEEEALLTASHVLNQQALRQGAPEEDPDLALAKMLQAQEQAWLAMAGSAGLENLPGIAGGAGAGEPAAARTEGVDAGAEAKELTDEEVARRLQEEEEREFQARLLALAGVGGQAAAGTGGAAVEGEEGEGAAQEGEGYVTDDDVDPDELTYEELTALGEAVGTVSRGLAQADIDALPQAQYFEVASADAAAEEQCPICRVEYEPEDMVKVLPLCKHYAHPECTSEWLKRNKVCCICNKEVLEDDQQQRQQQQQQQQLRPAAPAASSGGSGVLGERQQQ
ncbi:hypothetical protein ABPG77_003752 [Micractinium sp. CCAP 211/92]